MMVLAWPELLLAELVLEELLLDELLLDEELFEELLGCPLLPPQLKRVVVARISATVVEFLIMLVGIRSGLIGEVRLARGGLPGRAGPRLV